jgi:hypothetical protein
VIAIYLCTRDDPMGSKGWEGKVVAKDPLPNCHGLEEISRSNKGVEWRADRKRLGFEPTEGPPSVPPNTEGSRV